MKKITQLSKKISGFYFRYVQILFTILFAFFSADIFFNYFESIDKGKLYLFAKELGGIGTALSILSVLFYPARKYYLFMKRRGKFQGNKTLPKVMIILSNIHPMVAVTGLLFLMVHGYLFVKVILSLHMSFLVIAGIISLSGIMFLFISGSFIKVKMSDKKLRYFHMFFAAIFIIFFVLHRYLMY